MFNRYIRLTYTFTIGNKMLKAVTVKRGAEEERERNRLIQRKSQIPKYNPKPP